MARFVIDSGATLQLASKGATVSPNHELLAPTLWRSEAMAALYEAVRSGEVAADVARERIVWVNALKIRLLGDAVLRRRAWNSPSSSGWTRHTRLSTSLSRSSRKAPW